MKHIICIVLYIVCFAILCVNAHADVIPKRHLIAMERVVYGQQEFQLTKYPVADLVIVSVVLGEITIGGFPLSTMHSIFLNAEEVGRFKAISTLTGTEVSIMYFGPNLTQAQLNGN